MSIPSSPFNHGLLGDDAQEALWRAYDLMEKSCSALDEAGRDGEDGQ